MNLRPTHELHSRRFGRNLGVGLALGAFIVIIFGLTIAKMPAGDLAAPAAAIPDTAAGN
jgi:hypothetical protein